VFHAVAPRRTPFAPAGCGGRALEARRCAARRRGGGRSATRCEKLSRTFVAGFRTVMLAIAAIAALGGVAGLVMVRNGERVRVSS
jgi:hypothetical protein